ncbi:CPBP family intramembrane metalloprotease [Pseudomonas aeruginosa]|nr:CPBP family intramembrane metalloprotease [Pseudomonas aeruginosa]
MVPPRHLAPRPVLPAPAGSRLAARDLLPRLLRRSSRSACGRRPGCTGRPCPVAPAPGGTPRLGPRPGAAAGRRRGGPVPTPATRLRQPQGPGQGGGRPAEPAVHHVLQLRQGTGAVPATGLPAEPVPRRSPRSRPPLALAAARGGGAGAASAGCRRRPAAAGTPRAGLALAVRPGQPVLRFPCRGSAVPRLPAATPGPMAGPWPALALASALFGLAHFAGGPLLMLFAGLAGLIYGLAWLWSGRLWVATLFHFGLNLTHLLLFTYPLYRPA